VAEVAQLTEALPALPDGYDTVLGERGINLSGGQKQRAAIARALAQDPPVFVLDDALSAVDAHTEAKILRALRGALEGRTSIVVSHRLAAVRDADWILVLDGGRIVEQGTHVELIGRGGRYWELLRRQQLEEELEEEEVGGGPA
jgi:ATP-binding cassette subfamily B multidrug efflux pump